eukprot:766716-Hanusia_phi.AAC.1
MAIQLDTLEKAQPCHLVTLDDGMTECEDKMKTSKATLLKSLAGRAMLAGNTTAAGTNVRPLTQNEVNHLANFVSQIRQSGGPLTHSEKKSMDTITQKAAKNSSASSVGSNLVLSAALLAMTVLNLRFLS